MKNLSKLEKFPDVQDRKDMRGVLLTKAGIKGFRMPLVVYDKTNGKQHVTAEINIYTSLAAGRKGVHLSKLLEAWRACSSCTINRDAVRKILEIAKGDADRAFIEIEFFYFIEKAAPVSKTKGTLDYKCRIFAELGEAYDFVIEAGVPVITLCPDSKEISRYGAHNQRSIVTIKAKGNDVWFEDLIQHAEKNASCDIYQILKKEDDKYVSETMYENPKFAEDLVRDVAVSMKNDKKVEWFSVSTENLESNHNYNAYAEMEFRR